MSLRTGSETSHTFGTNSAALVQIVAGVPNLRISVYKLLITVGSPAVQVQLIGAPGNYVSQPFILGANASIALDVPINDDPWWQTIAGDPLQLLQNVATTVGWDLWYLQRP